MSKWIRLAINRVLSHLMRHLCWWYRCRIRPVNGQPDQAAHDQLVQQIFFESGIFDSPDTELAPDREGTVKECFFAKLKQKPAGAITVVQHPQQLPVQEYFNIELPDEVCQQEVAEVTRFVIAKDCRIKPPVVSIGLLNTVIGYARRKKIKWLVCCFPSLFIWGFQAYFNDCRTLEQLPLTAEQIKKRKGREAFFAESRAIRVILIDLESVDICRGASEMIKHFRREKKRSSRKRKAGRR